MAYSDFKFHQVLQQFQLTLNQVEHLFAKVTEVEASEILTVLLRENTSLALDINTEKARSEMIIAPLLLEVRRQMNYQISLFSGSEFNISPEQGLNGICDFLISRSPDNLFIQTPVVMLVEAKREDIKSGLGQCVAEMIAAQQFNQQEGNAVSSIYGVVTSGNIWRFLKLEDSTIYLDGTEYYINQVNQILGIFLYCIRNSQPSQ